MSENTYTSQEVARLLEDLKNTAEQGCGKVPWEDLVRNYRRTLEGAIAALKIK